MAAKCLLRGVCESDADTLLAWENDPRVWGYGGEGREYTREEMADFIRNQQAEISVSGQRRLMIVAAADGKAVGVIDLYEYDGTSAGVGVLVYDEADRRKGYGTQALRMLVHHAKSLGIGRLYADIAQGNTPSERLFTKCGFRAVAVTGESGITRFVLEAEKTDIEHE